MILGQTITSTYTGSPVFERSEYYTTAAVDGEDTPLQICEQTWDYNDFVDHVEGLDQPGGEGVEWNESDEHDYRKDSDKEWTGCSWYRAKRLAAFGWPEGAERLTEIAAGLPEVGGVRRPRLVYDYVGARPSVERYTAGEPRAMVRTRKSVERPVVCLRLTLGYNWQVTATQCANWAVGLVSLVDSLETAGIQTEIMGTFCTRGKRAARYTPTGEPEGTLINVMLRQVGRPLDIDRLAFAVGHPVFFRRYWWGLMQSKLRFYDCHSDCFGASMQLDPASADLVIESIDKHKKAAASPEGAVEFFQRAGAALIAEAEAR